MLREGGDRGGRMLVPAVAPQLDESGVGGYPNVFVFPPTFTMSGRKLEVPVLCSKKNLVEGEGGAETLRRKEKDGAKHLGPQLVLSSVRPPQAASS